jgi:hypothetical protein
VTLVVVGGRSGLVSAGVRDPVARDMIRSGFCDVVVVTQHGDTAIQGQYSHRIWLFHDKYPTSIMPLYSVVDIQNGFY